MFKLEIEDFEGLRLTIEGSQLDRLSEFLEILRNHQQKKFEKTLQESFFLQRVDVDKVDRNFDVIPKETMKKAIDKYKEEAKRPKSPEFVHLADSVKKIIKT